MKPPALDMTVLRTTQNPSLPLWAIDVLPRLRETAPMMIRILAAAAVVLPVVSLQPAKAYEAPWCAVIENGTGSVYWDCQYRSIEECRPNVLAGNRGWCNPSPYFVAGPPQYSRSRTHAARARKHYVE
jgi:hypothetical protein